MLDPVNYKLIFVMLGWIFASIFIIVQCIKNIYNILPKSQGFITKIVYKFHLIIQKSLVDVYIHIAQHINDFPERIAAFSKKFYDIFSKKSELYFIILSFGAKFIVVIILLIDIFVFFKLKYFFQSLILLSIPIIISVMIFILKDFAGNKEELESYLVIQENGFDEDSEQPRYIFLPAAGHEDIDLSYHVEQFINCSKIEGYLLVYDSLNTYYTPRLNLMLYTLYLFGWFYVLYMNLAYYNLLIFITR